MQILSITLLILMTILLIVYTVYQYYSLKNNLSESFDEGYAMGIDHTKENLSWHLEEKLSNAQNKGFYEGIEHAEKYYKGFAYNKVNDNTQSVAVKKKDVNVIGTIANGKTLILKVKSKK